MKGKSTPINFNETRRARIRSRFRSIDAHDERKRFKLRWIGYFAKITKKEGWQSRCERPFEEFTDSLKDIELHAPAHISQDSDSDRLMKMVPKSRKHSIFSHFPKDRNCEVCLRTNMTRAPCRRRTGEALPRAEKNGDMILLITRSLMRRDVNLETITGTLSLFKILPLLGFNPFRAKQRLHWRRKRVSESSSSRRKNQKLLKRIIHWNWGNPVKNYDGVIEPHRSETNGIAERAVRRVKEGTSAALLQSGLDEKWWAGSMECSCFLRNVQDLVAEGKTRYERRFVEPFKGQ